MGPNISIRNLNSGAVIQLPSGRRIFKLSSHPKNPIVDPRDIGLTWLEGGVKRVGSVFNPGAEIFGDKIVLTPRCHKNYKEFWFYDKKLGRRRKGFENYISEICIMESLDGINFHLTGVVIKGDGTTQRDFTYGIEDVRIVKHKNYYILIGCGKIKPPFKGENADRIAIYTTKNFREISYRGIIRSFDSRNAVPIIYNDEEVYLILRFHPHIYIVELRDGINQLLNPKDYEKEWEKIYREREKHLLLKAGLYPHEKEKIGAGPPPIKTDRGWLFIYHAVGKLGGELLKAYSLENEIDRGYSINAALLNLDNPKEVLCRTETPLYIPSKPYELWGDEKYPVDVPAVVFPTGSIVVEDKLLIYGGAGDKYVILLTADINLLLEFVCKK